MISYRDSASNAETAPPKLTAGRRCSMIPR